MGKKSRRKEPKPAPDGGGAAGGAPSVPAGLTPAGALASLRDVFTSLGKGEWWWLMDESQAGIAKCLGRDNYVVIDGFLGKEKTDLLKGEVHAAWESGRLAPGQLAGGKTGGGLAYTFKQVRGDHMGWFRGDEEGMRWEVLREYLKKVDTLVSELGNVCAEAREISCRSNAMTTVYPGGDAAARYTRHCDNPNKNGRKLTALFYLNTEWQEGDGGELRVYRCLRGGRPDLGGFTDCDGRSLRELEEDAEGREVLEGDLPPLPKAGRGDGTADDAVLRGTVGGRADGNKPVKVVDVPPRGDRLLLFWSDARVPHEVLPSIKDRYAITTWYFDGDEVKTARAAGRSAEAVEAEERKAREEIEKMQHKYHAEVDETSRRTDAEEKRAREEAENVQGEHAEVETSGQGGVKQQAAGAAEAEVAGEGGMRVHSFVDELRSLVLTVDVPGAAGAADVDLQVGGGEAKFCALGGVLSVPLPARVDVEAVSAKWSKRRGQLTVTLPKSEA